MSNHNQDYDNEVGQSGIDRSEHDQPSGVYRDEDDCPSGVWVPDDYERN